MTYGERKTRDAKGARRRIEYRAAGVRWDWRSVGAVVGISGGVVSALVGAVLTAFSWFMSASEVSVYVRTTGTVLLVLMIPLLVFGAHCLDLTEKRKKSERESRFK
jgi:amino acid transporter